jgi:hypothetical protein
MIDTLFNIILGCSVAYLVWLAIANIDWTYIKLILKWMGLR